jgi:copper chaperone CopZ
MRIPQIARRALASLALLAACGGLLRPRPAFAQASGAPGPGRLGGISALVIPVAGMTCALCTRGVEQSIKLLDSVLGASAELSTGLVRVEAAEGRSLNIRDIKERVQKAGFKVGGECEVEAIGRFTIDPEGQITFRIPGTVYAYQVLEGGELKRMFRGRPGLRGNFFVVFRLHEHPRWKSPAISIVRGDPRGDATSFSGR